jgi:hypothetical protein
METVTIGWLFGYVAMLAFGLILVTRSVRLSGGKVSIARRPS